MTAVFLKTFKREGKKSNDWSLIQHIVELVRQFHPRPARAIVFLSCLTIFLLLLDFAAPLLLRNIVLCLSGIGSPAPMMSSVGLALGAFFLLHPSKAGLSAGQLWCASHFQSKILEKIRSQVALSILRERECQGSASGGEISALSSHFFVIENFLKVTVWQTAGQALFFLGGAGFLFVLNRPLSAIAFLPIPMIYFLNRWVWPRYRRVVEEGDNAQKRLSVSFQELLEGRELIRGYQAERQAYLRFTRYSDQVTATNLQSARWASLQSPIYELGGGIAVGLILMCGWILLRTAKLDVATLLSFIIVLGYFYRPVFASTRLIESWQRTSLALKYLTPHLHSSPEDAKSLLPMARALSTTSSFEVIVSDLSAGYKSEVAILKELRCQFRAGAMTGILGPNGAGKSTLIKVLAGLVEPMAGQIRYGDLPSLPLDQIAYLPQNPFFFDASAQENLKLVLTNPVTALEACEVSRQLGLNLDSLLQDDAGLRNIGLWGKNLSGGQRQRLSLLRFALRARTASVCLLDEPTNFIDLASENALIKTLLSVCRDKTTVIVTHRDWVLDLCDETWVMDQGTIKRERFIDFKNGSKRHEYKQDAAGFLALGGTQERYRP